MTDNKQTIETQLPLVDEILDHYREAMGDSFTGYRNHVYRVVNLCYWTGPYNELDREKIQIAGAFHDIGIWTDNSLDYLQPSADHATRYLTDNGRTDWISEVTEMIVMHHRLSSCQDSQYPLVEAFRRADIADFSLGVLNMGFPRAFVSQLKKMFPNSGFHPFLLRRGSAWFLKHPLRPLPMFRR